MNVACRGVTASALAVSSRIWNEGAATASRVYRAMPNAEFAERAAGREGVPADLLVVAEYNGEPAGFALGCTKGLVDPSTANLAAMVVRPGFRGRGLGRAMLGEVEAAAARAGCRRILLSPVSHVRFVFGVDPATFGYGYLWGQGYRVCQTHLYMRMTLRGWAVPDGVRRTVDRLVGRDVVLRMAEASDTTAVVDAARRLKPDLADTFQANAGSGDPLPVLVAVRAERVVGFVGRLWVTPCDVADFDFITVDPAERGQGVGKALFCLAMEHFARQGVQVMELMTGPDNPAQKIYLHAGFDTHTYVACFEKDL